MRCPRKCIVLSVVATASFVVAITVDYFSEFGFLPEASYTLSDDMYQALLKINSSEYQRFLTETLHNQYEITIVTLYINIGKFKKGDGDTYFTADLYRTWMESWGMLTNRVVGFFEDAEDLEYFRKIRSLQPEGQSHLMMVNRSDLSSFNDLGKVREIFRSASYPKHSPNTVVPEYSCTMSAKYNALEMAISKGLVQTKYIAWLDIGLFRNLARTSALPSGYSFTLEVPEHFNTSCVSMAEITPRDHMLNITARDFIWKNLVWVGGGFVLATTEVMKKFSQGYKRTRKQLLDQNLASTDQQVIGAMFSADYIHQQSVDVRGYRCKRGRFGLYGQELDYFCFAYICKEAAERRRYIYYSTLMKKHSQNPTV